jgi:hypothetical protein
MTWPQHEVHNMAKHQHPLGYIQFDHVPPSNHQAVGLSFPQKLNDVKGVAMAKLRLRVPQCLAWPAIARWNRERRTRRLGVVHAYL